MDSGSPTAQLRRPPLQQPPPSFVGQGQGLNLFLRPEGHSGLKAIIYEFLSSPTTSCENNLHDAEPNNLVSYECILVFCRIFMVISRQEKKVLVLLVVFCLII